jgi:hypothetical protein
MPPQRRYARLRRHHRALYVVLYDHRHFTARPCVLSPGARHWRCMSGKRGPEADLEALHSAAGGSRKRAMATPMAVDAPKAIDEDLHRRALAAARRARAAARRRRAPAWPARVARPRPALTASVWLPALSRPRRSRQLAVYGRESMRRLAGARILVAGLNGLGVEIGARRRHLAFCPNSSLASAARTRPPAPRSGAPAASPAASARRPR